MLRVRGYFYCQPCERLWELFSRMDCRLPGNLFMGMIRAVPSIYGDLP